MFERSPDSHGGRLEIFVILAAVREFKVEITRLLPEGEVVGSMDGECEGRVVARKNSSRPVALVNVQIQHSEAFRRALRLSYSNRDGHIVEDAEAFPVSRERVVRPAIFAPTPSVSAARLAAIVPPTDLQERSTSSGDHGNPMRLTSSLDNAPENTSLT